MEQAPYSLRPYTLHPNFLARCPRTALFLQCCLVGTQEPKPVSLSLGQTVDRQRRVSSHKQGVRERTVRCTRSWPSSPGEVLPGPYSGDGRSLLPGGACYCGGRAECLGTHAPRPPPAGPGPWL